MKVSRDESLVKDGILGSAIKKDAKAQGIDMEFAKLDTCTLEGMHVICKDQDGDGDLNAFDNPLILSVYNPGLESHNGFFLRIPSNKRIAVTGSEVETFCPNMVNGKKASD